MFHRVPEKPSEIKYLALPRDSGILKEVKIELALNQISIDQDDTLVQVQLYVTNNTDEFAYIILPYFWHRGLPGPPYYIPFDNFDCVTRTRSLDVLEDNTRAGIKGMLIYIPPQTEAKTKCFIDSHNPKFDDLHSFKCGDEGVLFDWKFHLKTGYFLKKNELPLGVPFSFDIQNLKGVEFFGKLQTLE
ncbi:MAG: hypothetical protein SchgKO_00010 [Schleiferiaceae bacterium]